MEGYSLLSSKSLHKQCLEVVQYLKNLKNRLIFLKTTEELSLRNVEFWDILVEYALILLNKLPLPMSMSKMNKNIHFKALTCLTV